MELRADDDRVFMAFSLIFLILAALSTQRLGVGSQSAVPIEKHKDVDKPLPRDTALLMIIFDMKRPVIVLGISSNCHKCDLQPLKENLQKSTNLTVETDFPFTLAVNDSHGKRLCPKYNLLANWKLFHDTESLINADLGSPNFSGPVDGSDHDEMPEKPKKQRLKSLDTFRGIALTIMIFVNSGGGGYYFFKHARWNGLTVADLVFPWFMWIMGVSMVISFQSLRQRQVRPMTIFVKILRRAIILFGLGLFVSNYADLAHYRIPGVLQRFAACYFIIAILQLVINPGTDSVLPVGAWWNPVRDIVALWGQWLVMLGVLAIYVIVTFALKMPGCPRGYIGPGGIADPDSYNCTGGNAGYIDRHLFGSQHITSIRPKTYNTKFLTIQKVPWVPCHLPSWCSLEFSGCITIGLTGTDNDGIIPLNKNLWSVSFIFATGGMAFLLLAY
ncbi:hypothetical protein OS493_027674 [Desmophyllum pertusum]|uniref:Heparan-alpha-glucosaminide N-acetyltransferase catalytic domain-containing protein n=1 Tax=Desmophyllum pertusum TaxID=174260 RepID=A0A9W9ZKP8_9CNID|nr:hypothetical protein OS493_027674 [Desmophyllum pertusum]